MISTVGFLSSLSGTIFTLVLSLSIFQGVAPTPNPSRDNTCNFSSPCHSIMGFFSLQRRSSVHLAFCETSPVSKEISQWEAQPRAYSVLELMWRAYSLAERGRERAQEQMQMQFSEYQYSYHTEKDISIIYCTSFYSNTC